MIHQTTNYIQVVDGELNGCLINKVEGNKIFPNKMDNLKVGTMIYRNFDSKFEKQLTNSKTRRKLGVEFVFENNILTATDEDKNSVKVQISSFEISKNPEKMKENFINQLNKTGESDFYVTNVKIMSDLPFMPVSEINNLRREILEKGGTLEEEEMVQNFLGRPVNNGPFLKSIGLTEEK